MNRLTMRSYILVLSVAIIGLIGCSEVEFKKGAQSACEQDPALCPVVDSLRTYTSTIRYKQIDILFVNDNSGSMSTEQARMGDRFPMFIAGLADLDYHIGMITTDVSASPGNSTPRSANGNGAFQDGKLLSFDSSGTKILTPSTPNVIDKFRSTVARPETIVCDNAGYSPTYCPSGDERGIYATNMLVDSNPSGFLRPTAHLAIVILSDENTRSNGGQISGKPIENYDRPETLAAKIDSAFGGKKTFSVHSIIIKPGDTACFQQQDRQDGNPNIIASYGFDFAALSDAGVDLRNQGPILPGIKGTICASDYGNQLTEIAERARAHAEPVQLNCFPADDQNGDSTLQVTFNPRPIPPVGYYVDSSNKLIFTGLIPVNTEITYSYKCR